MLVLKFIKYGEETIRPYSNDCFSLTNFTKGNCVIDVFGDLYAVISVTFDMRKSCNGPKTLNDFHKDKSRVTGYHPYCKTCRKIQAKEHYKFKNPIKENKCIECKRDISHLFSQRLRCDECKAIKETNRKRPSKDLLRQKIISKLWRRKNPEKCKAYNIKHNKLRKDKI